MGDMSISGDALANALGGDRRLTLADGTTIDLAPTVILDLDGKGVQTLKRSTSGVRYDLDGDGLADQTSWIGTTEGFLFLDRDGDGTLTSAGELSFLSDMPGATSDLQGLRAFDSTLDGTLSAQDKRFADFRIWQDKNGNGVVDTGEVQTLAAAGVRSINLTVPAYSGTNTGDDVAIVGKGGYTRTNGTTMDLLDAALTYTSAPRDGLPRLQFVSETFDRKAKKYRITAKDGQLSVTGKGLDANTDSRAGGLVGSFTIDFRDKTVGMLTAIVLDLDGNGVSMTARGKAENWFDMNGDGSPDEQGWISKRDGFLVIDRNNDGRINDGSELSFLAEDPTAKSSLAALAKLDSNGDKVIDKNDARFGELRVWIDANSNGSTDPGELKTLAELGIQSFSLAGHNTTQSVKPGSNLLIATSTFTYTNGMTRTLGDAALAFRPSAPPDPVVPLSVTPAPSDGGTSPTVVPVDADLPNLLDPQLGRFSMVGTDGTLLPPQARLDLQEPQGTQFSQPYSIEPMKSGTDLETLNKVDVAPSIALDIATASPNALDSLGMLGGAVGLLGDISPTTAVPFALQIPPSGTDNAQVAAAQFVDAVSGFAPAGAGLIDDLHNGMAFVPVSSLFQNSNVVIATSQV